MSLSKRIGVLSVAVTVAFLSQLTAYAIDENEILDSGKIYYGNECSEKLVALTFDDGPHKFRTDEILDVLKKYNVKATFFVVGTMAKEYPHLIKRELAEGHEIGNHTYSHHNLKRLDMATLEREIELTEEAIFEACEYRPKLFRPPEGWCTENIASVAGRMDYDVILWNIDTLDWAHTESKKIYECVSSSIKPGSIILFHDYVSGKSPTIDALEMIIPKLLDEGYRFVTVSELIATKDGN